MAADIDLEAYCREVRSRVWDWVGLRVGVGLSVNKTLAKLAQHAAKKFPKTGGVVDLRCPIRQKKLMALTPVEDVWGIGSRLTRRLHDLGVKTALDLAQQDPREIRSQFSVVVEKTVRELQGEFCVEMEEITPTKQQIMCSRSFGERVTTLLTMREAVSAYVERACEKLRAEGREARCLMLFITTSTFATNQPRYSNSRTAQLAQPTADTRAWLAVADQLLEMIWRDGYAYSKAGIMLSDFYAPGAFPLDLFQAEQTNPRSAELMAALDRINQQQRGQVFFAAKGAQSQSWQMKRSRLTPAYTTRWSDIISVR